MSRRWGMVSNELQPPDGFLLEEWKGKVDPAVERRELINVGIIVAMFVVAGLAMVTGLVTWVTWIAQLING